MSSRKKREQPPPVPPPPGTTQYLAASGARFSDEEAAVYGRELQRIAEKTGSDLRSLDKHVVYAEVERDPNSPLHKFIFDTDDDEAARLHRIERCGLLIRSIRVVALDIKNRPKVVPQFVYVPDATARDLGRGSTRSRVMIEDVIANDPAFASAVGHQLRTIEQALRRLEHIISMRRAPENVREVVEGWRRLYDEYQLSLAVQAEAAE